MLYGIHMKNRYGLGKARSSPRKIKIAIQHPNADLIMKDRSSGPFVFLMLKYVPMIPPAKPRLPPAITPIHTHMALEFIPSSFPQNAWSHSLLGTASARFSKVECTPLFVILFSLNLGNVKSGRGYLLVMLQEILSPLPALQINSISGLSPFLKCRESGRDPYSSPSV